MRRDNLRVLMVTPRYFPYMGGTETHVHEVGQRLAKAGLSVTLLTTMPDKSPQMLPHVEEVAGMQVIRVRSWLDRYDGYIAPEIFSIIAKKQWDLLHCQGCHTSVPPMAMLAAQRVQLPYLVTFHTGVGGQTSLWQKMIRGLQWTLQRPLFAGASKLVGVSHFEVEYFRNTLRFPGERFSIIPNGAYLPAPHPVTHSSDNASNRSLIVAIGRLIRQKGHQRLIAALPRILEQRPDARLLLLGGGPYESDLRRLAEKLGVADRVEMRVIPASNRQEMANVVSQAALVALLSDWESHPIAVMEALSLRRPVLVTNTSGMRELAQRRLVRAIELDATPEQVARAALQQIEDPLVPDNFALPTWEECTNALVSTYMAVVGRERCAS